MNYREPAQRPARHGGLGVAGNFGLRHFRIVFERQRRDALAVLAAAADAGEAYDRADIGAALRERRDLVGDIEVGLLDADGHASGHEIIAMAVTVSRRSSAGKRQSRG